MEPVNNNQVIADLIADAKQQRDDIAQSVQQLIAIRDLMKNAYLDIEKSVYEAQTSLQEAALAAAHGVDEWADPDEVETVGQMIHWSMQHDEVIDDHDV